VSGSYILKPHARERIITDSFLFLNMPYFTPARPFSGLKSDTLSSSTLKNGTPSKRIEVADQLYHVLISKYQPQKDPNATIPTPRVCGTYISLQAAKNAAQQALFDAGYEREWFTVYSIHEAELPDGEQGKGVAVYAIASDGTKFEVYVATTPNVACFRDILEHRVQGDLWYVVQINLDYEKAEAGQATDMVVEGAFRTKVEAWKVAKRSLLDADDGITKESFEEYDEAPEAGKEGEFEENVVVHAVGEDGINHLVVVVKEQALESVRVKEAAMRMRD